jgi:hypothetical protein
MLMVSGDDHTAPGNGHFLAGLDPRVGQAQLPAEQSIGICLRTVSGTLEEFKQPEVFGRRQKKVGNLGRKIYKDY